MAYTKQTSRKHRANVKQTSSQLVEPPSSCKWSIRWIICYRCHQIPYFNGKMHQIPFRLGFRPRPCWVSSERFPTSPSMILGVLVLRRGRKGEGKGKDGQREGWREGKGGKRMERERGVNESELIKINVQNYKYDILMGKLRLVLFSIIFT